MVEARAALELWLWRHPRPQGAARRCIGRTDVAVDRRRVKRAAGRILRAARRHALPRVIWTSPLQRCAAVGRCLARQGFRHHVDPRLLELDFGRWDGQPWDEIDPAEVARWEADLLHHAPGGGEALAALVARAGAFVRDRGDAGASAVLVVAHAGWIRACSASAWPAGAPHPSHWPGAPPFGTLTRCAMPRPPDASGAVAAS